MFVSFRFLVLYVLGPLWTVFDGTTTVSYEEAREHCDSLGGFITTPTSLENFYRLVKMMKKYEIIKIFIGITVNNDKTLTFRDGGKFTNLDECTRFY